MKKGDWVKKAATTVSKKKALGPRVQSDEEISELLAAELPEKVKEEVCQGVAKQMRISAEEVRRLMAKLESGIPSRQSK